MLRLCMLLTLAPLLAVAGCATSDPEEILPIVRSKIVRPLAGNPTTVKLNFEKCPAGVSWKFVNTCGLAGGSTGESRIRYRLAGAPWKERLLTGAELTQLSTALRSNGSASLAVDFLKEPASGLRTFEVEVTLMLDRGGPHCDVMSGSDSLTLD